MLNNCIKNYISLHHTSENILFDMIQSANKVFYGHVYLYTFNVSLLCIMFYNFLKVFNLTFYLPHR
jgi:hypothetical protein